MNLYGFNNTMFDLGYSDAALMESITSSHLIADRRYTEREEENLLKLSNSILNNIRRNDSPPKHRHDGTSPLPLGMDWSPPPPNWDGSKTIWPHDFHTGWSYCVTIPSWNIYAESRDSKTTVFYRVQIGLQSPEGVTTTYEVLRRFSDFLKLYSDLKLSFRNKKLSSGPHKGLLRMKNRTLLEERRCSLESWMEKLLTDIDISRSAPVACFLELEAAARSSFRDSSHHLPNVNNSSSSTVNEAFLENNISTLSKEIGEEKVDNFLSESSVERIKLDHIQKGAPYTHLRNDVIVEYPTDPKIASKGTSSDTKANYLETELESEKHIGKGNLEQEISVGRESSTLIQCDMEELRRKFVEVEFKFETEQNETAKTEATKTSITGENESLQQEQLNNFQQCHEKADLKIKSDVELLVKEIKSVRRSQSELQQELDRVSKEKVDLETRLEKEQTVRESVYAANRKLLHECEILRGQLKECRVNFLDEQENKLNMQFPHDAIDVLVTSENRIDLLLSEAQALARDVAAPDLIANNELRKMLADVLIDNANLQKREISLLRCALNTHESSNVSQQQL